MLLQQCYLAVTFVFLILVDWLCRYSDYFTIFSQCRTPLCKKLPQEPQLTNGTTGTRMQHSCAQWCPARCRYVSSKRGGIKAGTTRAVKLDGPQEDET